MTDFLNNFKAIHHFIKGIFRNAQGEYNLSFVQDPDGRWYIDMPWDGNRANLEMVAGADTLLSFLDKESAHRVNIVVIPSEKQLALDDCIELCQIDKSLWGGSNYSVANLPEYPLEKLWICPVTLCVLGSYPKFIYIRKP